MNEEASEQPFHIPAFGAIRANSLTWLSSVNTITKSTALAHPPTVGSAGSVWGFVDRPGAVDSVGTGDDGEDLVKPWGRGAVVGNVLFSRESVFWVLDLFLSLFWCNSGYSHWAFRI